MMARSKEQAIDSETTGDLRIVGCVSDHDRAVRVDLVAFDKLTPGADLPGCQSVAESLSGFEDPCQTITVHHALKGAVLRA